MPRPRRAWPSGPIRMPFSSEAPVAIIFVIPVLSGHQGGATRFAESVAGLLAATPVITTASDALGTLAVDILGRDLGWKVEAPKVNLLRVAAHVVNGEPIASMQEAGSRAWWNSARPLPGNIRLFDRFEDVDLNRSRAVLWVTRRTVNEAAALLCAGVGIDHLIVEKYKYRGSDERNTTISIVQMAIK